MAGGPERLSTEPVARCLLKAILNAREAADLASGPGQALAKHHAGSLISE